MKLLFYQNLSPRLPTRLRDLFPGYDHLQNLGMERAQDNPVWEFARTEGFVIITKDEDFNQIAVVRGFPPKIIWLQLGNCTTDDVEAALRGKADSLHEFHADPNVGTFVLR